MFARIQGFFLHRSILRDLCIKQIKTKYAGSFLGIFWAFLNPLLLALIVAFVFTEIIKVQVDHFYLFVISGMLPWTFFAASLQEASLAIVNNAPLLKQASLPKEFLPLAAVLANFFNLLVGLLIMLPFFLLWNHRLLFSWPWLVPVLFLHLVFTSGLSLLFSSLNTRFRDVGQFLGTLLVFWLWMTPVFYGLEMVPDRYRILFQFNPMTVFIGLYRQALWSGAGIDLGTLGSAFVLSVFSIAAGLFVFARQESAFLKRL